MAGPYDKLSLEEREAKLAATAAKEAAKTAAWLAQKAARRAANKEAWALRQPNPNKLVRTAVNRELWDANPNNRNAQLKAAREAKSIPIPEIVVDAIEGSASLAKLRSIMADGDQPIYRRMDCADVIIDYELAPGAAANVPADQLASSAFQFFRACEASEKTPSALRFRALKAIARIENSRRSAAQTPEAHFANREFHRRLVNAARSQALRQAGVWEKVVASGARWALETGDAFEMPVLPDYISASIEKIGLAEYLDLANRAEGKEQHAAGRAQVLLSVRASNRDDAWEQLLGGGDHAEQNQIAS